MLHPNFDPVALQLGPIAIHWYGLMYVFGFMSVYFIWSYRIKHYPQLVDKKWNSELISDLLFYGALGAVIGGRLGYVLFYKPEFYFNNPLEIAFINQGGMSFHGGLLGVTFALFLFSNNFKFPFPETTTFNWVDSFAFKLFLLVVTLISKSPTAPL